MAEEEEEKDSDRHKVRGGPVIWARSREAIAIRVPVKEPLKSLETTAHSFMIEAT